jgi:hypothetical protein
LKKLIQVAISLLTKLTVAVGILVATPCIRQLFAVPSAFIMVRPWTPDLGPRRLPVRRLFVTEEFAKWAAAIPSDLEVQQRLLKPATELDTIAADFVAGEKIVTFMRRIDPPKAQGVLRFNTSNFRLAGWCPEPQTLILAQGALASRMHGAGRPLTALGREVVRIRKAMGVLTWERGEFYALFRAIG